MFFEDEVSFPAGTAVDCLNRIYCTGPVFHNCNEFFIFAPVFKTLGSQHSHSVSYRYARADMSVELYSGIEFSIIEIQVLNSYFNYFSLSVGLI